MFKESFVIDTDIIVDLLRGFPNAKKFFMKIEEGYFSASFSVITEAELFSGKSASSLQEQARLNNLLSLMTRINMDKTIAQKAGEVRRKFNVPFADSIIAATTLHFGTKTLVTKNIKHYKSIKDIKIKNPY